ncbi:hypothetical protein [Rhizobium bangladeshense]|uniref:hypothetical protein n=1 Tax=Rhizobium bangladeshense TaxID=1138189 RepID=UPI001C90BFA3|nr:hypothetical protein [Rhizobium bangladeshense]MBY3598191.1 hypothetical protein [Rhizobium bangladeshense]
MARDSAKSPDGSCRGWTKTIEAQISANGQFFWQSGATGWALGQHGMSSAAPAVSVSAADMCISGIEFDTDTLAEEAIALSATPMLTGPNTTPSIASTQSMRWNTKMTLIRLFWHAVFASGKWHTKD